MKTEKNIIKENKLRLFDCKRCGHEFETNKYIERDTYFVADCPVCEGQIFSIKFINIFKKKKLIKPKKIKKNKK
jgi:NAD-dependent SIR2 family protein deacetylase